MALVIRPSSGKITLGTSGKTTCTCCDLCAPLAGLTSVSLSIRGVSLCECYNFYAADVTPPVGAVILSFSQSLSVSGGVLTGSGGSFSLTETNAITHTRYIDRNCITPYPIENPSQHDLVYSVTCAGGSVTVFAYAPAFGTNYFYATGSLENLLTTGISNSLSGCSFIGNRGFGGTAILTV